MNSPNYDERSAKIDMLLLHYTGMKNCDKALARLCDENAKYRVSTHYVVDEGGMIYQLVDEANRAWHSGVSFWAGTTDINSCSIGIEIVNGGHAYGLPAFPKPQMTAVKSLSIKLIEKYNISSKRVLGHSDVSPLRRKDPGENFDWQELAASKIGLWCDPPVPDESADATDLAAALKKLKQIGYDPKSTSNILLCAFQRHYRPLRVDGILDQSTLKTIDKLIFMSS